MAPDLTTDTATRDGVAPDLHPTGSVLLAIGWRAALVIAAAAAAALGAPAWLTAPLTCLAAIVVAEWALRTRGRGLLDAALVGLAGIVLTAIGLGLILNVLPPGLTRPMWSLAAGLVGVNVLLAGLGRGASMSLFHQAWARLRGGSDDESGGPPTDRRSLFTGLACGVLAVVVIAGAFVISTRSAADARVDPLEISALTSSSGVQVRISSGTAQGPFDLILEVDAVPTTVATGVQVEQGIPISIPVTIPAAGRVLLELVPTGSTDPVRELIFDAGVLTAGTTG